MAAARRRREAAGLGHAEEALARVRAMAETFPGSDAMDFDGRGRGRARRPGFSAVPRRKSRHVARLNGRRQHAAPEEPSGSIFLRLETAAGISAA